MHILISNDDGYLSPGIKVLADAVTPLAQRLTVIAPDRNRSAASNSLTVTRPLRIYKADNNYYAVDGTPTDCVHLGMAGAIGTPEPDIVLSGINMGANLGDDVLYSGTVAAAMEGRHLGHIGIAFSMPGHSPQHLATGGQVAVKLLENLSFFAFDAQMVLNVNIPDLPWSEIKGWKITRLGRRHRSEAVIKQQDPKGNPVYWVGNVPAESDASEGTDFHAVRQGYVSITPLKADITGYAEMQQLADWINEQPLR